VAASAFGALNGFILTSARILMAMGRDHHLFSYMARIDPRFSTPAQALAFNALCAVFLVWIGTFEQIVTYSTVAISVFFAMTALAVIVLRRRDPETPRPYRVWGYPLTPIFFILALFLFIVDVAIMQPIDAIFGFGLMALGIPLYAGSRRMKRIGVSMAGLAVLLLGTAAPSLCAEGPKEKRVAKAVLSDELAAPQEPSPEQMRRTIRDFIAWQQKSLGSFLIPDPQQAGRLRALSFVRVHEQTAKSGGYHFSCADMRDLATGEELDLDFDIADAGREFKVVAVRIHKDNGKPRYTYDAADRLVHLSE